MEEWRMIDICQAYEVSSLGRIKRVLPRHLSHKDTALLKSREATHD